MDSTSDTDQRLTELEIKASYSEDLLEQLNLTIYRQQLQIDALRHDLQLLRQQQPDSSGAQSARRAAAALLGTALGFGLWALAAA